MSGAARFDTPGGPPTPPRLPFDVPFAEAIAWAQARRAILPDEFYGARLQAVRARSFSIAGLAALDQLQDVADSLASATASGQTFREWQKALPSDVFELGAARRELIFRNAVQTHYGIGRTIQQRENAASRPYLMWDAINDSRTRPTHRAMDGHIAPVDDPIWKRWSPPAGHRCRCSRVALSEAQARARGYPKGAPAVEPDKGWEGDPTEGNEDLLRIIRERQASCATTFGAKKTRGRRIECDDQVMRESLEQMTAALSRDGALLPPKSSRGLSRLDPTQLKPDQLVVRFLSLVDAKSEEVQWTRDLGLNVQADSGLFRKQAGDWKVGKNDRAQWIEFLADTFIDPAEVRLVDGPANLPLEIRLIGRYELSSYELLTLLAFSFKDGAWHGQTAYHTRPDLMSKYRNESMPLWYRKK